MATEVTYEYRFGWEAGETYFDPVPADKYEGITFNAPMEHFREPQAGAYLPDRYEGGYRYDLIPATTNGSTDVTFTYPARSVVFSLVGVDAVDAYRVQVFNTDQEVIADQLSGPRTNDPDTFGFDTELVFTFEGYVARRVLITAVQDPGAPQPRDTSGYGFDDLTIIVRIRQRRLPPRRVHPRGDALAGSSAARTTSTSPSEQSSNRTVGGYL